ncbi:mitotic checkpoint regulator, MAD2B-interacting-domain-containing protein [Hypoxylon sp. FL1284]|nr:mitotic checkpoint regulator, MAD2B-interacting-domain-containing protein [Hypoxylon sp. FL1284]
MGLVDYSGSESESENEPVAKPVPAPAAAVTSTTGKKPFQKIIDHSQPGKIRVNLPQASEPNRENESDKKNDDGPPAKRARVAGAGGAFSGFNSFLPPPKNTRKPVAASSSSGSSGKPTPRPGVNLKTGAAPGFSREADDGDETNDGSAEPPSKQQQQQPSIPAEQKAAEEVKLVGKPLMFRPLSVSRKPVKKSAAKPTSTSKATAATAATPSPAPTTKREAEAAAAPPPPKKQKLSLFSIPDESTADTTDEPTPSNGVYEPMFDDEEPADDDHAFAAYDQQYASAPLPSASSHMPTTTTPSTLDAIAADMNLSAAARRELFGRGGVASASSVVTTFDTGAEYARNEALRASGAEQPVHNPLRTVAPGAKHSLRQLVDQARSQRDALEDSFARGRSHRGEAGAKYGWR